MEMYCKQIKIIFTSILLCILLVGFLPIPIIYTYIGCGSVCVVAIVFVFRVYRYYKTLKHSTDSLRQLHKKIDLLPAKQRYRLPIIMVVGNAAKSLFYHDYDEQEKDSGVIVSVDAIWVYVEHYSKLTTTYESLIIRWPEMYGRIGVCLAIAPEALSKKNIFLAELSFFKQSWRDTSVIAKYSLPIYITLHMALDSIFVNNNIVEPAWFSIKHNKIYLLNDNILIDDWIKQSSKIIEKEKRLHLKSMLYYVRDWYTNEISFYLKDEQPNSDCGTCVPIGIGIYPLNVNVVDNNLFQNSIESISSLSLPKKKMGTNLISLPDKLVKYMPITQVLLPLQRMFLYCAVVLVLFIAGCICSSYYNNKNLLLAVQNDVNVYNELNEKEIFYSEAKEAAFTKIKEDKILLEKYFIQGEPIKLSFGLYTGLRLQPFLDQAISNYKPYKQLETPAKPTIVRLNSLSLFDVGKADLKLSSNKVLIEALTELQKLIEGQKTGWLVLITGHTDSVGDAIMNQRLSEARAIAVKNWLVQSSKIPVGCFVTKGYGATQPLVDNNSPQNMAKNRRVELTIIPQVRSCELK